jgi:hypothetical protein
MNRLLNGRLDKLVGAGCPLSRHLQSSDLPSCKMCIRFYLFPILILTRVPHPTFLALVVTGSWAPLHSLRRGFWIIGVILGHDS